MKQREIFEFTAQLATIVVTHRRIISQFLRREHSLEYNEFAILLALRETGNPQQVQAMTNALSLTERMLWTLLLEMENRGLVIKDVSLHDGRAMSISLSSEGRCFVDKTLNSLDDLAQRTFWAGTSLVEVDIVSRIGTMKCLENLEVSAIPTPHDGAPRAYFNCGLLTYIRLMPRRWESVTQGKGNLTLGEYRLLNSLERLGPLSPHDAAQVLLVQKSSVSSYKDKLLKENLIMQEANPADKRSVILANTPRGNKLSGYLTQKLNDMTRSVYEVLNDHEVTAGTMLTTRMYHNLRLAQS